MRRSSCSCGPRSGRTASSATSPSRSSSGSAAAARAATDGRPWLAAAPAPGHRAGRKVAGRHQNRVAAVRDRTALLAQWAREIASSLLVQPLPLRLCLACARLLGADGGAITLAYTRSERVTLCATDDVAARLEDLQEVLGQGPGPDAYRSGQAVAAELASPAAAGRWPMFAV